MLTSLRSRWVLPLLISFMGLLVAASSQADSTHGKTLVRTVELPLSELARFELFNRSPINKDGKSKVSIGAFPDSESWVGEALPVSSSGSPYTIVIKTHGLGISDGDAEVRWQPGWNLDGVKIQLIPTKIKKVAADRPVEFVTASGPLSFRESQTVQPGLEFIKASNVRIDRVQVEVWSGIGDPSLLETLGAFRYALLGMIMLGFMVWFRRS